MQVYGATTVEYLEEKGIKFLQKMPGYEGTTRNNLEKKTAPDYALGSLLGDCQYSGDFDKWFDLRIDTISAHDSTSIHYQTLQDRAKAAAYKHDNYEALLRSLCQVMKLGKMFDPIDFILYFVYGHTVRKNRLEDVQGPPKRVYILNLPKFKELLAANWQKWTAAGCLRFNKKSDISDDFGSAFTAIKPRLLASCLTDYTQLYNEV